MNLYAVYDRKLAIYNDPFVAESDKAAIAAIKASLYRMPSNVIEDSTLVCIGAYDRAPVDEDVRFPTPFPSFDDPYGVIDLRNLRGVADGK